jgi:protease secretion system membrane fusion protein
MDEAETPAKSEFSELHQSGSRPGRIGMWALILGLGGFFVWAGFAPLDEGVPATAIVSIDTKRRPVQHLSGGLIKEVLVREGQSVKEGQVLIRLDAAVARSNYENSRQRYLGLRANQGRLLAEQSGQPSISYHPDLLVASQDPLIKQQMQMQDQLFQSRRSGLHAELQGMEEAALGQEGLIQSYDSILISRRSQLALLTEELNQTKSMVAEGYSPRNRQLELERGVADVSAAIADMTGNSIRAKRTISELRQRMLARQLDYRKEVESQLADISRDVLSESEKYVALQNDLSRTEIKSPAEGQVVSLSVQGAGGVIGGGQKLMDIVPDNEPLILEAKVAPHLIDKVHAGLQVDIRFSTFAHTPQLVVMGKVITVSGDMIIDQPTGGSYFLARIVVTPEGMKQLGVRQLQPGMPAEVVFRTGERTMLTYLLNPLTKRLAASMKEE